MLTGRALFDGETVSDTLAARAPRGARPVEAAPPGCRPACFAAAWNAIPSDACAISATRAPNWSAHRPSARPAFPRAPRRLPWMVAAVMAIIAAVIGFRHFREGPQPGPLIRLSVSPAAKGGFSTWLSLSPDGRHLAFTGAGSDGVDRLWLHSFDSLEPRPIAGTEGTSRPSGLPIAASSFFNPAEAEEDRYPGRPGTNPLRRVGVVLGGSWNATG